MPSPRQGSHGERELAHVTGTALLVRCTVSMNQEGVPLRFAASGRGVLLWELKGVSGISRALCGVRPWPQSYFIWAAGR